MDKSKPTISATKGTIKYYLLRLWLGDPLKQLKKVKPTKPVHFWRPCG